MLVPRTATVVQPLFSFRGGTASGLDGRQMGAAGSYAVVFKIIGKICHAMLRQIGAISCVCHNLASVTKYALDARLAVVNARRIVVTLVRTRGASFLNELGRRWCEWRKGVV